MRHPIVLMGLVVWAACGKGGDARCKAYVEHSQQVCIQGQTQSMFVDGKKVGQLMSDEEARESCKKVRADDENWCRKASDEVLDCAMKPFDDPVRKGERCQKLLEEHWAATHPGEAKAPETMKAPARTEPTAPQ